MDQIIKLTDKKEIVYASFIFYKNGLDPVGNPSFEEWLECGEMINKANGAIHFWIGDWLNFGEKKWGERYLEAIKKTKYDYGTLRNDKWVAARVDLSRRHDKLTFDHHTTVAELEPEDQDLLLSEAEEKKLNSKEFRKYVAQREFFFKIPKIKREEAGQTQKRMDSMALIINSNNELLGSLELCDFTALTNEEKRYLFSQLVGTLEKIMALFKEYKFRDVLT